MDPISALGVAATAVQFLDSGLEALSWCREFRDNYKEIRKDDTATTSRNRELEAFFKNLKDLSEELKNETQRSNRAGRRITKIAKDCIASADELQDVLKKVRSAGNATLMSSAITTFRTMKERKTIEKLQNTLKDRRALLDSALIQDIRDRVDLAAITHSKQYATLSDNVKDLTTKLQAQQSTITQSHAETKQDLTSIKVQNETLLKTSSAGHGKTQSDIDDLKTDVRSQFSELKLESAKEEVLLSLFFPDHLSRREMLDPPWERTFDWVFEDHSTTHGAASGSTDPAGWDGELRLRPERQIPVVYGSGSYDTPDSGVDLVSPIDESNNIDTSDDSPHEVDESDTNGTQVVSSRRLHEDETSDTSDGSSVSSLDIDSDVSDMKFDSDEETSTPNAGRYNDSSQDWDDEALTDNLRHRSGSDSHPSWPSFSDWLSSSNAIYWISGKAGSGKSTLMAHVVNNSKTKKLLSLWAGPKYLQVASFFFWRPGSSLQKSLKGLLRSLLYQVLEETPDIAEIVLRRHPLPKGRIPEWTEKRLRQYLKSAVTMGKDHKICFFIDGLDEFEGDQDKLLDLLFSFQEFEDVKFCVSSRPEDLLVQRLSNFAHLRMEDLNYQDIDRFVLGTLSGYSDDMDLIFAITDKAEGVFLWAALASQSLIKGIKLGDDEALLHKRLELLPKAMNGLFSQMLSNVDAVYKETLGIFLRIMEVDASPNTALVAASLLDHEITRYSDFWRRCREVERQISVHSGGILQVSRHPEPKAVASQSFWAIDQSSASLDRRNSLAEARKLLKSDEIFGKPGQYQLADVRWIHRSAYEFIFGEDGHNMNGVMQLPSHAQVLTAVATAKLRLLVAAPSVEPFGSTKRRISNFVSWISTHNAMLANSASLLDEIRCLIRRFSAEDLRDLKGQLWKAPSRKRRTPGPSSLYRSRSSRDLFTKQFTIVHFDAAYNSTTTQIPFWMLCLYDEMYGYVQDRLAVIALDDEWWIMAVMIRFLFRQRLCVEGSYIPDLERVKILASLIDAFLVAAEKRTNSFDFDKASLPEALGRQTVEIDICWQPSLAPSLDTRVQREAVLSLCECWMEWETVLTMASENQWSLAVKDASIIVTRLFIKLLDLWRVGQAYMDFQCSTASNGRITLMKPAWCFPELGRSRRIPGFIEDAVQTHEPCPTSPFRLLFREFNRRDGLFSDVALFHIDRSLHSQLYSHGDRSFHRLLDDAEFRDALITDVWKNSAEDLNGFEQLYAVACIRTHSSAGLPKYYRRDRWYLPPETFNPQGSRWSTEDGRTTKVTFTIGEIEWRAWEKTSRPDPITMSREDSDRFLDGEPRGRRAGRVKRNSDTSTSSSDEETGLVESDSPPQKSPPMLEKYLDS